MKKLLLAATILITGAVLAAATRNACNWLRENLAEVRDAEQARSAELETARAERLAIEQRTQDLKQEVRTARSRSGAGSEAADRAAALAIANQSLSPEQSEVFLAALGFNWNAHDEYLIVSKETLRKVSMSGMRGPRLKEPLCGVLALSPAERSAIEATAERILQDYTSWMAANVQRTEPHGDVVAQYKVTFDEAFTQRVSSTFSNHVFATIGPERGELLLEYGSEWMRAMGMLGVEPTTLTVNQHDKSEPRYQFTIKATHSSMTAGISPWQPFPEAFKPLFPNGWADLAKAEGFELPPEFQKHQAQ